MFDINVTFDIKPIEDMLNETFGDGGVAQYTWSRIVFDNSVPYMPALTGNFIHRSMAVSEPLFAHGELVYPGPFAHYLWEGILYVDPETGKAAYFSENYGFWSRPGVAKVPTDMPLEYTTNLNEAAGARWTERAAADLMPKWEAEMQEYVDRGFPNRL